VVSGGAAAPTPAPAAGLVPSSLFPIRSGVGRGVTPSGRSRGAPSRSSCSAHALEATSAPTPVLGQPMKVDARRRPWSIATAGIRPEFAQF
jgi:hypothetical protein